MGSAVLTLSSLESVPQGLAVDHIPGLNNKADCMSAGEEWKKDLPNGAVGTPVYVVQPVKWMLLICIEGKENSGHSPAIQTSARNIFHT